MDRRAQTPPATAPHPRRPRALLLGVTMGLVLASVGLVAVPTAQAASPSEWSTGYETGEPQALSSQALGSSVNLAGQTEGPQSLVTSVYSATPNSGNQDVGKILDRNPATKWYYNFTPTGVPIYAIYTLSSAAYVDGYSLTQGSDSGVTAWSGRATKSWKIFGSNDDAAAQSTSSASWQPVDTVTNQDLRVNYLKTYYAAAHPGTYKYYMLQIDAVYNTANKGFQLADWTLRGHGAAASPLTSEVTDVCGFSEVTNVCGVTGAKGDKAVRYAGSSLADGEASATSTLHADLGVVPAGSSALTYWVYPLSSAAASVAVDLQYSDGGKTKLLSSDAAVTDTDGAPITASAHGSSLSVGQWNQVVIPLSSIEGKTVTGVLLTYDNQDNSAPTAFAGWVDDIRIGASPYTGELDTIVPELLSIRGARQVTDTIATIIGDGAHDASKFAATLDLNDGTHTDLPLVLGNSTSGVVATFPEAFVFAQAGLYDATVTVTRTLGAATTVATAPITISVNLASTSASILAGANVACISVAGTAANCDGNNVAFDKAKLAALGVVQGASNIVALGGTNFYYELPDVAPGDFDNLTPAGQSISIQDYATPPTRISFVGTANEGTRSATVVLHYTDGTTQDAVVKLGDWVGAASTPIAGNTIVASTTGRLTASGTDSLKAALYASDPVTLALDGAIPKTLDRIQLPTDSGDLKSGHVHIFAIATDSSLAAGTTISPTAVVDQSIGQAFTAELATVVAPSGTPTATINWGDGSATQSAPVAGGKVSGTHTYAARGSYTVTVAAQSGITSATTTTTVLAVAPATSTTISGPSTANVGDDATFTATVVGTGAAGTVEFFEGETSLGSSPVALGSATLTVDTLVAGTHAVMAVYSGDATHENSASQAMTIVVSKWASSVALEATPTSATAGDEVVLTATVTANGAAGTVEFFDGASSVGVAPLTDGSATLDVRTLPGGMRSVHAVYSGDPMYQSSTSPDVTVEIITMASQIRLTTFGSGSSEGIAITLLAEIEPATATGTVEFFDGAVSLGSVGVADAAAGLSLATLTAGAHAITAVYSGDPWRASSASGATTVSVSAAPAHPGDPSTAKVSAPTVLRSTQTYGSPNRSTLRSVVTGATSGTVTFRSRTTVLGTVTVQRSGSTGVASLVLPASLKVGSYATLTATFTSGSVTAASPVSTATLKVVKAKTKKVKVKAKKFTRGTSAKVTVIVGTLSNGHKPVGKVKIYLGKKVVKTVRLKAKKNGKITVKLPRYTKRSTTVKIKARFLPADSATVKAKTSKVIKVKVRK